MFFCHFPSKEQRTPAVDDNYSRHVRAAQTHSYYRTTVHSALHIIYLGFQRSGTECWVSETVNVRERPLSLRFFSVGLDELKALAFVWCVLFECVGVIHVQAVNPITSQQPVHIVSWDDVRINDVNVFLCHRRHRQRDALGAFVTGMASTACDHDSTQQKCLWSRLWVTAANILPSNASVWVNALLQRDFMVIFCVLLFFASYFMLEFLWCSRHHIDHELCPRVMSKTIEQSNDNSCSSKCKDWFPELANSHFSWWLEAWARDRLR